MPLIPAYFWVRGQPGQQSEFQDTQDSTQRNPVWKTKKQNKQTKKKNKSWNEQTKGELIQQEISEGENTLGPDKIV